MYTSLPAKNRQTIIRERAASLFDQSWFVGKVQDAFYRVARQRSDMLELPRIADDKLAIDWLERTAIPIDRILGSNGRPDRFNRNLHPRQRRDKNRWMSVAVAMMSDITLLPPIEVVEYDGLYYVVDGHHRVSVARALRKIAIDANVVRWHVES